jgi:Ca-activated chloride channel family protein
VGLEAFWRLPRKVVYPEAAQMKFGNISYLLLLWLFPVLVVFYLYAFRRKDRLSRTFCGGAKVWELVPPLSRGRQRTKALLMVLAVLFVVGGLIRPKWGYHWEDIKRVGVDIVVAIDVSESMLAEDIKPSRLERAKREVLDLMGMLEGDRIGLVAFAGTSFIECPLTLDYGAFGMFVDYLDPDLIPVPGTAIADAIKVSLGAFDRRERKSKALILITDGEDHEGEVLEAAKEAKKEGVQIFPIGIGKEEGAPIPAQDGVGGFKKDSWGDMVLARLDETSLQRMALETGGTYVRSVTGDMDLERIYKEGIREKMEKKELRSTRRKRWEERFQWPVFLGLLVICLEFFLPERRRRQ